MLISHYIDRFKQCSDILSMCDDYLPAPCVSPKNMRALDVKSLADFSKPNADFFNAEKAFIWSSNKQYKQFEAILLPFIDNVIRDYIAGNQITDWDGYTISYFSVLKYKTGGFFKLHQDTINQPCGKFRSLSICIYLSDFEGGELTFPQHNLTIKPGKGDVIVFPSGEHYKHIAEKVIKGVKYCLTLWPLTDKQLEITRG